MTGLEKVCGSLYVVAEVMTDFRLVDALDISFTIINDAGMPQARQLMCNASTVCECMFMCEVVMMTCN